MITTRKETDSLGVVEVPTDKLWGAEQTILDASNRACGWPRYRRPALRTAGVV